MLHCSVLERKALSAAQNCPQQFPNPCYAHTPPNPPAGYIGFSTVLQPGVTCLGTNLTMHAALRTFTSVSDCTNLKMHAALRTSISVSDCTRSPAAQRASRTTSTHAIRPDHKPPSGTRQPLQAVLQSEATSDLGDQALNLPRRRVPLL